MCVFERHASRQTLTSPAYALSFQIIITKTCSVVPAHRAHSPRARLISYKAQREYSISISISRSLPNSNVHGPSSSILVPLPQQAQGAVTVFHHSHCVNHGEYSQGAVWLSLLGSGTGTSHFASLSPSTNGGAMTSRRVLCFLLRVASRR